MSPIMGLIYLLIVIVAAAVIVVVARKKLLGKRKDPDLLKDSDSDSDSLFEEDGEDAALEEPIPVAPAPVPVSQTVKKTLGRLYIQEKGKSYPDIHVPLKDGRQQEVPDLYLCQSGFYIFDSLDMDGGWIVGSQDSRWWTRFTSPEDKDFFDNPVLRLEDGIRALSHFFPKTDPSFYHGYLVVSNTVEIRSVTIQSDIQVINQRDLESRLTADLEGNADVLDEKNIAFINRVLAVMGSGDDLEQRLMDLKAQMKQESEKKRAARKAMEAEEERNRKLEQQRIGNAATKIMVPPGTNPAPVRRTVRRTRPEDRFTRAELALRDALILWRQQEAENLGVGDKAIFDDFALDGIVSMKPQDVVQLRTIPGFDTTRCQAYGSAIINMVRHSPC